MAKITINKSKIINKEVPYISDISFDYMGEKLYAAQKIQKMYGFWISQPIIGSENMVSWNELLVDAQKNSGADIWIYLRGSSSLTTLETTAWNGPYLNTINDISAFKNIYLQIMVVLSNSGLSYQEQYQYADTPVLRGLQISYLSSATSAKFYTKAFSLGFVPKHVVLTYNGDVSLDSVVRFAISGFDTINSDDYQYIEPNKIQELSGLSILSDKIKVLIEMIGDSGVSIKIHEFALMFSGNQALMLVAESSSSSSSDSSSSISSISSSSSSSGSSSSSSSSTWLMTKKAESRKLRGFNPCR